MMKYKSYQFESQIIDKAAQELGVPRSFALASYFDSISDHYNGDPLSSLNCVIMYLEECFMKTDKEIIFLDSQRTIDQLLDLKFSAKLAQGLTPDIDSFMLSVPAGVKYDGIDVKPCLVSVMSGEEYMASMGDFVGAHFPKINLEYAPYQNVPQLRVCIPSMESGRLSHTFIGVDLEMLPMLVNTPIKDFDMELYKNLVGDYGDGCQDMDLKEIKEQLLCIRLVASMAIYNRVTGGKYFKSGLPKATLNLKQVDVSKFLRINSRKNTFKLNAATNSGQGKSLHVRSAHIRQLVAERYYQGEHESTPVGHRFVEVKESLIGKGEASTQTSSSESQ